MTDADAPSPIRLDDLADPRFSDEARAIMEAGAAMADQAVLAPDALCAAAVEQLGGPADFGSDDFRTPLTVLCDSMRAEAGLSPFGRVSIHAQLVQLLKNRLLVTEYLRRHPDALEQEVHAPIVIAGLPRTGTTHLHNLIAADPALRSLPYWESLEPLPAPGEEPGSSEPRVERCEIGLAMSELFLPELPRMHEMTAWHAHEEIALLAIDCSTMFFDTLAPLPTWRAHYRASDQRPHYEYLRRVLQVLQHARGGARWVLKSPQHLEQFGVLAEVFPDATYVVTHRDPGDVVVSMATMIAYTARMHLETVDPVALGAHWTGILTDLLSSCAAERDLLAADRSIDVRFDDFMADEAGTVASVYAAAGQPLDAAAVAAHEQYRRTHRRNRHGAVVYEPDVLGIDPAAVRAGLRDYCGRFGV